MKERVKRILKKRPIRLRRKKPEESLKQALQGLPRITNETVAEHREEVLSSARKYIYPLKHSPHRVVIISTSLLSIGVIAFFSYCVIALYRFDSTSSFIYRVTQVIPFPVAKAGPSYVSYESYLFELRHYIHYYQTQQRVDFSSESGKQQLAVFRQQAMNIVIDDAYVKQLASQHHISVSNSEVNNEIQVVKQENRLGSSNAVFEDVLKEFWGWSIDDFKRELKQEMLDQKVVATLDTATTQRAQQAYQQLEKGADFATIAQEYSDDASTKANGGAYGFTITQSDQELPPQVINTLFQMKQGQVSGIINTGATLEILKVDQINGDKIQASHISFTFRPLSTFIDPLRAKEKPRTFISQ